MQVNSYLENNSWQRVLADLACYALAAVFVPICASWHGEKMARQDFVKSRRVQASDIGPYWSSLLI